MKFTADRDVILKEILISNDIIGGKNTISILSNVLLETVDNTLTIRATDLKVSFQTQIPVDTETPGCTTVMCDKFLSILRSLPEGDIQFAADDGRLQVFREEEKINFKIRCIGPEEFPAFSVPDAYTFSMGSRDYVKMIDHTIFSVSEDETRFYMNGVYIEPGDESLVMVSTDGRILSLINKHLGYGIPFFEPVIIPPKFLQIIRKTASKEGNIELTVTDTHVFAHFDSHYLSSTLIEGKFPNYKRVIPQQQNTVCTVKTKELYEALRRVSLLVDQKSKRLYVDMEDSMMVISSEESEMGIAREELHCQYNGEKERIIMNSSYLINPLRVMDCEYTAFVFSDPDKAVRMRPEPEEYYFHIIMPMS